MKIRTSTKRSNYPIGENGPPPKKRPVAPPIPPKPQRSNVIIISYH